MFGDRKRFLDTDYTDCAVLTEKINREICVQEKYIEEKEDKMFGKWKGCKGFIMNAKSKIFRNLLLQIVFLSISVNTATGSDKIACQATYGSGIHTIKVATGSPGSLGLLKALAKPFCKANHCQATDASRRASSAWSGRQCL